eukprot:TRINITY_DN1777_c0_g1_i1.p1 TRINITY_DN1777_c0_g1~~TRINITY_DN1777_c0_g1_i1.p1  ORF type:complete len:340 (+),score=64.15 TRINITY_DN1777_c0_g1_i1:508-1527(+)
MRTVAFFGTLDSKWSPVEMLQDPNDPLHLRLLFDPPEEGKYLESLKAAKVLANGGVGVILEEPANHPEPQQQEPPAPVPAPFVLSAETAPVETIKRVAKEWKVANPLKHKVAIFAAKTLMGLVDSWSLEKIDEKQKKKEESKKGNNKNQNQNKNKNQEILVEKTDLSSFTFHKNMTPATLQTHYLPTVHLTESYSRMLKAVVAAGMRGVAIHSNFADTLGSLVNMDENIREVENGDKRPGCSDIAVLLLKLILHCLGRTFIDDWGRRGDFFYEETWEGLKFEMICQSIVVPRGKGKIPTPVRFIKLHEDLSRSIRLIEVSERVELTEPAGMQFYGRRCE